MLSKSLLKRRQQLIDQALYEDDLKKFKQQLAPYCLIVEEMDADGNCLFRAIADQLEGDVSKHEEMRKECIDHILRHKESFVPFIEDDRTIEDYCKAMAEDSVWGGQLEMNALANALKFNVIVHQVDNPSMAQVFHEPIANYPIVHLSYHLEEHYNSVRRMDDPCIKGQAPTKFYKIGHDLNKIRALLSTKREMTELDQYQHVINFAL